MTMPRSADEILKHADELAAGFEQHEADLDHELDPEAVVALRTAVDTDADAEFDRVLTARDLNMVFQPVVSLRTSEVVGLEALVRGPAGSDLESAGALLAAARRRGRLGELDWACRAAAFDAFAAADLPPAMSLFVNIEPESLATPCPPDLVDVIARAESRLRVFVEVNDRALAADPSGLILAVDRARSSGWGVALDDVGSSTGSLAVLPLVGADVVKLDLRLLRENDAPRAAAITLAVLRLVESSGAALLVEGIETAEDARWAAARGATFGQGYRFGRPGPLQPTYPMPRAAVPLRQRAADDHRQCAPSHHLSDHRTLTMSPEQLDDLARTVFYSALAPGSAPVILGSRGAPRSNTPMALESFPALTMKPLVQVMFGPGGDDDETPGARTVVVHADDPLARENFLVILRGSEGVALAGWAAQESGMVDVVLTHDTATIHQIVRHLFRRIPSDDAADDTAADEPVDTEPDEPLPEGADQTRGSWRLRRRRP
jgi:EAL domain-containing protein (putative c-di-GMP-specific phosphodiesterase class I)